MFVSFMAKLNAISLRNNAQYGLMQNRSNMLGVLSSPAFIGYNMSDLQSIDTDLSMKNDYYQTMYILATEQEKAAAKMMEQEAKHNKISYIA